jgi:hypothetical protein
LGQYRCNTSTYSLREQSVASGDSYMVIHPCVECGKEMLGSPIHRKFCSALCKGRWRKKNPVGKLSDGHTCRMCGKLFSLSLGQANKWLCSEVCRRASNNKKIREFHERRPMMSAVYRARTREKRLPDSNHVRFYREHPNAPRFCESCGDNRVLDIAHKPGRERLGARRQKSNCAWPRDVWILCPTCHALHDRMHYLPEELGLTM